MASNEVQTFEQLLGGVDELRASLAALTERVTDVFLRAETLRDLMIRRGVFSKADFDLKLDDLQELWGTRRYFLTQQQTRQR